MHQIQGLASLHELGIKHGDIKPENVLLSPTFHVALADFGLAAQIDEDGKWDGPLRGGTLGYSAPEVINPALYGHHGITETADIWSLGVLVLQLVQNSDHSIYSQLAHERLELMGDDTRDLKRVEMMTELVTLSYNPAELSEMKKLLESQPVLYQLIMMVSGCT